MSLSRRSRTVRGPLLLAAAALLLGACSTEGATGVAVRGKEVDVAFGLKVKPIDRLAGTPQGVPAAPVNDADGVISLPPSYPDIDIPGALNAPPIFVENCPAALATATIRVRADTNVPPGVRPAPGTQMWAINGTADGKKIKRVLEERQIADVADAAVQTADNDTSRDNTFGWTFSEPEAGGGYARTTFQLKPWDRFPNQNVVLFDYPTKPGVGPPPPDLPKVHEEEVGAPDRGLAIQALSHFDGQGSEVNRFAPPVGLLVLPLPVSNGVKFVSRTVDPVTQQVWIYTAQVTGRPTIDACGELLQGYLVQGQLSTDGGTTASQYDFVFAPQYGGIVISEHRVEKIDGVTYDRTFTIGQLPQTTKKPGA